MQTKLTLRMEERVIGRAKAWARSHGVSLSELVAAYLANLAEAPERNLGPWTRRLTGVARRSPGEAPNDEQIRADHAAHVEAKHR